MLLVEKKFINNNINNINNNNNNFNNNNNNNYNCLNKITILLNPIMYNY